MSTLLVSCFVLYTMKQLITRQTGTTKETHVCHQCLGIVLVACLYRLGDMTQPIGIL